MPTRTNLIASGNAYAASATFTVDAGTPATIHLNGAAYANCRIERYDGTNYYNMATIVSPGAVIMGQGTYRAVRDPIGITFQVDVEK
jgi:hypothetical protein